MKVRRLACSLVLVGLFITCINGDSGPYLESHSSRAVIPAPGLLSPPDAPTPPELPTGKSQTPSRQGTKGIPDVDECQNTEIRETCEKMGKKCFNTVGSYKCLCDPGYHYERKKCRDKNECAWRIHNCSHQSYCRNTEGSFQCVCPKGHELVSGVKCIPNDLTRWTTPKYLLKDLMDGVVSRIAAAGAAAVIVLSLLTIAMVCCKRKCKKWAEERELKRLAYEEQLMVAAGIVDPNQMFFGEGYPEGDMYYPENMGYAPEDMGYPPEETGYPTDNMGYPMGDMGYGQDNVNYGENNMAYGEDNMAYGENDMAYGENNMAYGENNMAYGEDNMAYAEDMGSTDDMDYSNNMDNGDLNVGSSTKSNFDTMVPHTYYEEDHDGEASEGEGEGY